MQLTSRRLGTGLAGLALVAGVAAYASGGSASAAGGTKVTSVAIATPAKTNDYGWNAQGVAGLEAAAKAYGISRTSRSSRTSATRPRPRCCSRWPPPTTA